MFRLLIILIIIKTCICIEIYRKCCDSDSAFEKKINSSYNCVRNIGLRVEILSNQSDFLSNDTNGNCLESHENKLFLYEVKDGQVKEMEEVVEGYFRKCCPLNYFYNKTRHGCVKSQTELNLFFNEKIIAVGLPQCKIIIDIKLNVKKDLERINATLLAKQNQIYNDYCLDNDENNSLIARICTNDYKVCRKIRCVWKCCPDGQSFIHRSKCYNTFTHGLDFTTLVDKVENADGNFAIIHGFSGPIYPLSRPDLQFQLKSDGVFMMKEVDESLGKLNVTRYYNITDEVYCIEHAFKKTKLSTINRFNFFRSFPKEQINVKFLYTRVAMAISCVFLILTIFYYCISNEKRTLFGKTLISYCVASLMAFLLLSYLAFVSQRSPKECTIVAFLILYLTSSVFTWMNVMCIDIYWTFGSSKSFSSRHHWDQEFRKFLWYCLHGWGTPLVLTLLPLIYHQFDLDPSALKVIVNRNKCTLYRGEGNYALFVFSSIPLAILIFCNCILFIKTTIYCLRVKREITKMNDTHAFKGERRQNFNKFQDRFGLLLKLFLIMGISFLFEIVSTFVDFKRCEITAIIEIIWDTFNSLQGFFIFVIFIVKKRIFRRFEQKVGLTKLRKFSLSSSAVTQTSSIPTNTKH